MNNKERIKKASLLTTLFIVVIGLLGMWYTFRLISLDPIKAPEKNKNVEINKNVYEKVTSPEKFGTEVSTNEEGYGRDNPFTPYK